jgi:hypothetical protein
LKTPGATVKQSDTGKGTVSLYENGVMHQVYKENIHLDMDDSRREMEIYSSEYCTRGPRPILVDLTTLGSVSKGSRGIYTSQETARICSRAALLVGNPVSRIMGNFYMGINKPVMPVKMFTDPDEAMAWLLQG